MNTIGARINQIRKDSKLTQVDFGAQLGISQTHVSKIEKDVENPSETLLMFISYKFCVGIDWIKAGIGEYHGEQGSSKNGTLNKYYEGRNGFEKKLSSMVIDQLWNYIDAEFAFTQCLTLSYVDTDVEASIKYLEHMNDIANLLFILTNSTSEIACNKNELQSKDALLCHQSKCSKLMKKLHEEIDKLLFDMLNQPIA